MNREYKYKTKLSNNFSLSLESLAEACRHHFSVSVT